jgi:hypothetical protein
MQKEDSEFNLFHVHNWIQFFISMYNVITSTKNNYFVNQLQEDMEFNLLTQSTRNEILFVVVMVVLYEYRTVDQFNICCSRTYNESNDRIQSNTERYFFFMFNNE